MPGLLSTPVGSKPQLSFLQLGRLLRERNAPELQDQILQLFGSTPELTNAYWKERELHDQLQQLPWTQQQQPHIPQLHSPDIEIRGCGQHL